MAIRSGSGSRYALSAATVSPSPPRLMMCRATERQSRRFGPKAWISAGKGRGFARENPVAGDR
eukprot:scaffold8014_cov248-Pinguiococcus_pyrenoidosus.AAC.4